MRGPALEGSCHWTRQSQCAQKATDSVELPPRGMQHILAVRNNLQVGDDFHGGYHAFVSSACLLMWSGDGHGPSRGTPKSMKLQPSFGGVAKSAGFRVQSPEFFRPSP